MQNQPAPHPITATVGVFTIAVRKMFQLNISWVELNIMAFECSGRNALCYNLHKTFRWNEIK
jgi:hypothetical protein